MGLHTWCLKRTNRTFEEAKSLAIKNIEREIELLSEILFDFKNGKIHDLIDPETDDIESRIVDFGYSLAYNERILSCIKKGLIKEAIFNSDFLLEIGHYDKTNKVYYLNTEEFHDVFRTNKRNKDGTYINDLIYSREDCYKWLFDNKDFVYDMREKDLNEFWSKYPDGMIQFG